MTLKLDLNGNPAGTTEYFPESHQLQAFRIEFGPLEEFMDREKISAFVVGQLASELKEVQGNLAAEHLVAIKVDQKVFAIMSIMFDWILSACAVNDSKVGYLQSLTESPQKHAALVATSIEREMYLAAETASKALCHAAMASLLACTLADVPHVEYVEEVLEGIVDAQQKSMEIRMRHVAAQGGLKA